MQIVHFTDPGCPWAFSAEPSRLRLAWTFGDQLQWRTHMIVLARSADEYERKGYTTAKKIEMMRVLQARYGMPIELTERPRLAGTERACRAVIATRLHHPEAATRILRALRVRAMAGGLLDDQQLIDDAARDAGLDPVEVLAWSDEPTTTDALEVDRTAARSPLPAARALDHKLAPSEDGGRRYTAPSLEIHDGDRVLVAPGMQPWESYDALVANLDPTLDRRAKPNDMRELLDWAPHSLATAEVAAIAELSIDEARTALRQASATFTAVGADGYWH